jgi:Cu-Zn family superoxide dismutase
LRANNADIRFEDSIDGDEAAASSPILREGFVHKQMMIVSAALVLAATVAFTLFGLSSRAETSGSSTPQNTKARATLRDAGGSQIGVVKLTQDGDSVEVKVAVDNGVAPGFHGFHVHAAGVCAAPFTSAMGHYNPKGATHRDHAGDLPVLLIDGDGEAEARFSTDRFALGDLFDADGSAFILHANADNYANIPTDRYDPDPDSMTLGTGDAGGRIACGVIEAK